MEHAVIAPSVELPRYQCHKRVYALKIAGLHVDHPSCVEKGDALLTPVNSAVYAPFIVGRAYMEKHKPEAGGYYVLYDDGYRSFSPAQAFESGYTRI